MPTTFAYNLLKTHLLANFSCVIAASANVCSQKIAGVKRLNSDTVVAYGLFGLIFTGPLSHLFYQWLDRVTQDRRFRGILMLLGERALFAPIITALSLYFITRFEGKDHEEGVGNLNDLYKMILLNNWKFLTLPVLINLRFVPPMVSSFGIVASSFSLLKASSFFSASRARCQPHRLLLDRFPVGEAPKDRSSSPPGRGAAKLLSDRAGLVLALCRRVSSVRTGMTTVVQRACK